MFKYVMISKLLILSFCFSFSLLRVHFDMVLHVKKIALDQRGETLVTVPCWWDGKEDRYESIIEESKN